MFVLQGSGWWGSAVLVACAGYSGVTWSHIGSLLGGESMCVSISVMALWTSSQLVYSKSRSGRAGGLLSGYGHGSNCGAGGMFWYILLIYLFFLAMPLLLPIFVIDLAGLAKPFDDSSFACTGVVTTANTEEAPLVPE